MTWQPWAVLGCHAVDCHGEPEISPKNEMETKHEKTQYRVAVTGRSLP
jgi:hypothetical protein